MTVFFMALIRLTTTSKTSYFEDTILLIARKSGLILIPAGLVKSHSIEITVAYFIRTTDNQLNPGSCQIPFLKWQLPK